MPLLLPTVGPNVIYGECNTPGTGAKNGYLFDTWYDVGLNDITASRDAALAAIGLSYNASTGRLTALIPMTLMTQTEVNVNASPGGADSVTLTTPDLPASPAVAIANPNTIGIVVLDRMLTLQAGEDFGLLSSCTNGSDTPISYAAIVLQRML